MEKKSSIAINHEAKELQGLLSQHGVIPGVEFVLRKQAVIEDKGYIEDANSQYTLLQLIGKNEALKLEKPYHISQIFSYVRNSISQEINSTLVLGPLSLDRSHCNVTIAGKIIHLTEKEMLLLQSLIKAYPAVVSKQQLMEQVWEYMSDVDSQTLSTHIYRLRQKLGQENDCICTSEEGYLLIF